MQCPAKTMPFQQIIMHALQCQHDLDVYLLFCFDLDLHNYNLFPRLCLTWIFSVNFYWWVQLCVQCPAKSMPFQQIIMHALQCQHDLDVHLLFYFDLDLHITSSRGCVLLGFSLSILTDEYHFACSAQQKPCTCLLNKLSCMHCNPSMM